MKCQSIVGKQLLHQIYYGYIKKTIIVPRDIDDENIYREKFFSKFKRIFSRYNY